MPRSAVRLLSWWRGLEIIVIGNIGDADDQHPHPAPGAVDDPGRDVDQRALRHGLFHAVVDDAAAAVENVVKLGGTLVIVEPGTINVDRVCPGHRGQWRVLVADQAVAPSASTALARCVTL